MPTNVPPQYREAEARLRAAGTPEEKIAILEEMLRIVPKHKGTDKLQADLKSRLAKLRRQPKAKSGAARSASHMVPKEGAGQVVLLGPPNSGKSALVDKATHASPKVGEYPFTTREALPGMMPYKDVALQLVDLPPISSEHVESWVFDCVRRADLVWIVVTHAASLDGFENTRALIEQKQIGLYPVGRNPTEDAYPVQKPALVVLTGGDAPESKENLDAFKELMESPEGAGRRILWPTVLVSSVDGRGLDELAALSFDALNVIRVYTKQPGKPPDREKPFTVPRDSTVGYLASIIHKDLSENIKFARMWGGTVFDGQRVQPDHVLSDGDIVEIHV